MSPGNAHKPLKLLSSSAVLQVSSRPPESSANAINRLHAMAAGGRPSLEHGHGQVPFFPFQIYPQLRFIPFQLGSAPFGRGTEGGSLWGRARLHGGGGCELFSFCLACPFVSLMTRPCKVSRSIQEALRVVLPDDGPNSLGGREMFVSPSPHCGFWYQPSLFGRIG